ncbi:MAG: methyltransferase domain-containing protein [Chloroflexota bacterium]
MPDSTADGQRATATSWDPNLYLRFADHRARPALELLARTPVEAPRVVYDLGCGTGEMARSMADRWPDATVHGLDSSPDMLAKSAATPSRVQWVQADIRAWRPSEPIDLLYSNATLQWVAGHRELFPRLFSFVAPGGCLAVQMPLSWDAPSHRLMRQTLQDGGPGGSSLGTPELYQGVARKWVDDATDYYDLLAGSAATMDIWHTEYLQVLQGQDAVLEWVKGTGLRPILDGLDDAQRAVYLETYARRLRETYPQRADGHTLYPFRRLFIVATRPA